MTYLSSSSMMASLRKGYTPSDEEPGIDIGFAMISCRKPHADGIFSGAVAIYKMSLLRFLVNREAGIATALYESSRLTLWTVIEANIIIIAAPIFRWFNSKTVGKFTGARSAAAATNGDTTKSSKYATNESGHNFSRITRDKYPAYKPDGSQIYVRDDFEVQSYRDLELDCMSPTRISGGHN